ncbi:restriction endonuclease, partial [Archangium violaceum]|uniref:nSTAND3 domain-containing NTPase n=1 Tax=Archangium violaceum TaxID=83451 RepID=UPI00126A3DED
VLIIRTASAYTPTMAHDFRTLTHNDFENLVRDLLQEELRVPLESFAVGRDKGIDLRHSRDPDQQLIIQCKHYAGSSLSTLISHLKKEAIKARKLKPKRYILATSADLSPDRKDEIVAIFSPHILTPQDIYGIAELNNLLGKFPAIERNHLKLYLTNWTALDRVLNNEIYNRTEWALDDAKQKVKFYVPSPKYDYARRHLEEQSVCVISGIPGIGKTTLAEMLMLEYSRLGWQAFAISSEISEAERVFNKELRQLFFYDDFLGQIGASEKLDKNEDERLVRFFNRVARDKNKRFVLTTREYILNQALLQHEKLGRLDLGKYKCAIELTDYTQEDRAKILYNHLYFSSAPLDWKRYIARGRRYRTIIDHPNYNPRLIEWVMSMASERASTDIAFHDSILRTLDNPEDLWRYPFEQQLSAGGRRLLLSLAALPIEVKLEDLKRVHAALMGGDQDELALEFKRIMRTFEKSFTRTDFVSGLYVVRLHNPSIRDFLLNYLGENPEYIEKILDAGQFFSQLRMLWRYSQESVSESVSGRQRSVPRYARLEKAILKHKSTFIEAMRRTLQGPTCQLVNVQYAADGVIRKIKPPFSVEERLLYIFSVANRIGFDIQAEWVKEGLRSVFENWRQGVGDKGSCARLLEVIQSEELLSESDFDAYASEAKRFLLSSSPTDPFDFDSILDLHDRFTDLLTETELEAVRARFKSWIESEGNEILMSDGPENLQSAYGWMTQTAAGLGVVLDAEFIRELEERAFADDASEHARDLGRDSTKVPVSRVSNSQISDRELESIFETMIEEP